MGSTASEVSRDDLRHAYGTNAVERAYRYGFEDGKDSRIGASPVPDRLADIYIKGYAEGKRERGGSKPDHAITFGLTDYEVSVLDGALQERRERWPDDAEACGSMKSILHDQLGPPTPDEAGWEILEADGPKVVNDLKRSADALTQCQHIAHDGGLLIDSVDHAALTAKLDAEDMDYIRALEAKIERICNIAKAGEADEDFRADLEVNR